MRYIVHDPSPSPRFAPEIRTYKPWAWAQTIAHDLGESNLAWKASDIATNTPTFTGVITATYSGVSKSIAVLQVPESLVNMTPDEIVAHLYAWDADNDTARFLPGDERREDMARDLMAEVDAIREGLEGDAEGEEWVDVRVCARVFRDDHIGPYAYYWLTVGDASYDVDHGDACGASCVNLSEPLTFDDALAIVDEMIEQVLDALAD